MKVRATKEEMMTDPATTKLNFDTRVERFHAPFDADVNVFGHDDGIVHHQTYGQDDGQHGKHIDGEARHVHHEEGTDQGYRNHDAGHQGDTPVAQEEEDDDDYQYKCLVDGTLYLGDGGPDELGVIESVAEVYVVR